MDNRPANLPHSEPPGSAERRKRRNRYQREGQREQISALLLRGENYRSISEAVGLSVESVANEIKTIRQRWHRQTSEQANELMSQFLNQLELIKCEAMREWDRSKQPKVKVVKKYCEMLGGPGSTPTATGGLPGGVDGVGDVDGDAKSQSGQSAGLNAEPSSDDTSRPPYPENPFSHTDDWGESASDSYDESSYQNPFGDEPVDDDASDETSGSGKSKKRKPGKSDNLLFAAEVTQTVEERLGDPRFLVVVQSCIEKQATMLGMNVKKIALTDPSGKQTYAGGAVQDMMALAEEVAQGPLVFDDSVIELEANKYLISQGAQDGVLASGESGELASGGDGDGEHAEATDDTVIETADGAIDGAIDAAIPSFPLAIPSPSPAVPAKKPVSFSLFDSPASQDPKPDSGDSQ